LRQKAVVNGFRPPVKGIADHFYNIPDNIDILAEREMMFTVRIKKDFVIAILLPVHPGKISYLNIEIDTKVWRKI